jgi:O-antigen/teichoic acid export membrane protein
MTQTLLSTVGNILVLEGKEKVLMYSGWASAAFVLIGIAIGVSISLEAVAAFYALAFIVGSLSFNVFFVYYKTLQYSSSWVIWFWMPKIAISILIWVGIYIDNDVIKSIGLVIWVILILTDVSKDAIKVYSLFTNRGDKNT